jgi:hypothetical protein
MEIQKENRMKTKVIGYAALIVAIALMPQSARAASNFKTFSGLGAGDVTISGTCADISCYSGHACFCTEGTDVPFKGTSGIGSGSIHIEMLMDNSTQTGNSAGVCENTGGLAFFTSKNGKNTLTFGLAGTWCQNNPDDSQWAAVNGSFNILSGGGSFSDAGGSGVFSFGGPTLDAFGTGPTQFQLTGSFNKKASAAAAAVRAETGNSSEIPSEAR